MDCLYSLVDKVGVATAAVNIECGDPVEVIIPSLHIIVDKS
jgi:hypothetical protein